MWLFNGRDLWGVRSYSLDKLVRKIMGEKEGMETRAKVKELKYTILKA